MAVRPRAGHAIDAGGGSGNKTPGQGKTEAGKAPALPPEIIRLAIVASLFMVNDLVFILLYQMVAHQMISEPTMSVLFFSADYLFRAVALYLLFDHPILRQTALTTPAPQPGERRPDVGLMLFWMLLLGFVFYVLIISQEWVEGQIRDLSLFEYPSVVNRPLEIIDGSIGLLLVAYSEEVVFRRVMLEQTTRWGLSWPRAQALQIVTFGIIHWATGPVNVIFAMIFGALFGLYYQKTRVLWPTVVAHWLINLYIFYLT